MRRALKVRFSSERPLRTERRPLVRRRALRLNLSHCERRALLSASGLRGGLSLRRPCARKDPRKFVIPRWHVYSWSGPGGLAMGIGATADRADHQLTGDGL